MLTVYQSSSYIREFSKNGIVVSATMIGEHHHSRPGFKIVLDNGQTGTYYLYDYYEYLLFHNYVNDPNTMFTIKYDTQKIMVTVEDQQLFFNSIFVNNFIMFLGAKISKTFDIKNILAQDILQTVSDKINFPKIDVKLYEYQKNTVRWMNQLESHNDEYKFNISTSFKDIDPNINVDYYFNSVTKKSSDKQESLHFKTSGGILADEMGLGKTLMSITNVLVDDYEPKHKVEDDLFQTKATLIIAPSHLAAQWIADMEKCNCGIKVLSVTTKNDHKNLTYEQYMETDFVVVTHQFLSNISYYINLPYSKKVTASGLDFYDRKKKIEACVKGIVTNKKFTEKAPYLEAFKWRRIIIDEGHELIGKFQSGRVESYLTHWIGNINSHFNWVVSGTPFTSKTSFMDMLDFLKFKVNFNGSWISVKELETYVKFNDYIAKNILKSIMNKNTKKLVKNELQIPEHKEELVKIIMTAMEKSLYDSKAMHKGYDKMQLRQLCCHPMIADQQWNEFGSDKVINLEDIKEQLIKKHKGRMLEYQQKISKLDPKAKEYNMLKKNYENIITESNFLLKVFDDSHDEDDENDESECPICRCPIDELAITKCGHKFCQECIEEALKFSTSSKQCPLCASPLKPDEIFYKKIIGSEQTKKINPLITKYGSKLGTLISYCRKLILNPNNKIILFSQFDRMLQLIGVTLADNGVENTIIKGNVYQRKKAIHKFRKGDSAPVMMLSTDHAASGTNLTEANHIIFIDPVDGTKEEVDAIEKQAIARAVRIGQENEVKVIRMITAESIEEEIWKKSNPQSKLESSMVMDA
jgi:SNF2 family DNA or RNA helicase